MKGYFNLTCLGRTESFTVHTTTLSEGWCSKLLKKFQISSYLFIFLIYSATAGQVQ